jgi:hypothetical protein
MMNTTLSANDRFAIDKLAVPYIQTGLPWTEQVAEWMSHGNEPTERAAHRTVERLNNRGLGGRVIDTATGEILISPRQKRDDRDRQTWQLARDLTPTPVLPAGVPNGYAWLNAVSEKRAELRRSAQ